MRHTAIISIGIAENRPAPHSLLPGGDKNKRGPNYLKIGLTLGGQMRKKLPQWGDKRIRTFFALFPITARGERRWLEKVTVEEQYIGSEPDYAGDAWIALRFLDRPAPHSLLPGGGKSKRGPNYLGML